MADAIGIWVNRDTGWMAEGIRDPKVGYYLADVRHDGHYLADSIRIERVAVAGFSEQSAKYRRDQLSNYQVFGLGDCTEVRAPTLSLLLKGATDPLGYYAPKFKISAGYRLSPLLGEDDQAIELDWSLLFTSYNKDPSHEPGGLISAARIYPTLTFQIPEVRHKKKREEYRRATAVQVIYRLNFKLDDRGAGSQCGLFADLEDFSLIGGAKAFASRQLQPGSFTFVQAEKPVMFDVAGGVKDQPPTTGLPYGAHVHWRWGASAATGGIGLPGGRQYEGLAGPGTPLIDPRIQDQTIEFAIVDRESWFSDAQEKRLLKALDQDPVSYLFGDFSNVWEYMTLPPQTLMPSGDLVIWFSITARSPSFTRELPDYYGRTGPHMPEFTGTFFPHGIFFPHQNLDDLGMKERALISAVPGGKGAQFIPGVPDQRWRR